MLRPFDLYFHASQRIKWTCSPRRHIDHTEVEAGAAVELEVLVDDARVVVALVEVVEIVVEVKLVVEVEDVDAFGFTVDVEPYRGGCGWPSYLATTCIFVSPAPNKDSSWDSPVVSPAQKENRPPEAM
jgi:hypothetical protein